VPEFLLSGLALTRAPLSSEVKVRIVPAAISLDHRVDRFGGIRPIARSFRKSQTEVT
jgi:hypothetical protein